VVVVSNTTPLNYLILVHAEAVLPRLFGQVLVPPAVVAELSHPATPERLRNWLARRPAWLEVAGGPIAVDPSLVRLDEGEREAIVLAEAKGADLLLMDDRDGVRIARQRGLTVIGTLGVLDRAAELQLIELQAVLSRLQETTFRAAPSLFTVLKERDVDRRLHRSQPGS